LIFCETQKKVDEIEEYLNTLRIKIGGMHGSKSQNVREKIIEEFKNGSLKILVATDIASRGIDVKDIEIVVNFDFPLQIEDYVHRIGRTGRAGKTGNAYSFFAKKNFMLAPQLLKVYSQSTNNRQHFIIK